MAMRLSGLMSGMDTESIIEQLVSAKKTKVDNTKKAQTKLEWKQDAWKSLNTKLKNLQSKYLSGMRFSDAYSTKTTRVSNSNAVSVITGENAVNGVQTLEIKKLAKTGYLTGSAIKGTGTDKLTALSKMSDLGVTGTGSINVSSGSTSVDIQIGEETTISDVLTQLKSAGLNANFDENNQRFFISAKESGAASDFSITASDQGGLDALKALGLQESITDKDIEILGTIKDNIGLLTKDDIEMLDVSATMKKYIADASAYASGDTSEKAQFAYDLVMNATKSEGATKINGQDAEIYLNGAKFTSKNNTFAINGLTFTALDETKEGEKITVTTEQDTDGIYDMVKNFLKEYNAIINEMDKLYNADSAKGYEPLTTEEKDALSDSEIEEYEKKIKDALLRRDENLNSVSSAMKAVMSSGIEIKGKT
ncbi:MAG: flagellar filament capping protein FliD, partial [Acetatifactor sp.]|nr:flagellar filament capping protein FliD [Acetatifactor sp.]